MESTGRAGRHTESRKKGYFLILQNCFKCCGKQRTASWKWGPWNPLCSVPLNLQNDLSEDCLEHSWLQSIERRLKEIE